MPKAKRREAFKYALALYIMLYGVAIYLGGVIGTQHYLLLAFNNNVDAIKLIGIVMAGFGLVGLFLTPKPVWIWVILIPYVTYASAALYGLSLTANPTPSGLLQFFAPVVLTFAYIWERTNV